MRSGAIFSLALLFFCAAAAAGQRIAVLDPEPSALSTRYAHVLADELEGHFRVLDIDLAAAAYASLKIATPFNQTTEIARSIGTVIGCDHFILVKTDTARRSSSSRSSYFEASVFIFLVNARSGKLDKFLIASKQFDSSADAEKALIDDVKTAASLLISAKSHKAPSAMTGEFEMFDPESKTMRPAMPYKRIKPDYTEAAFLHDVKATVDAVVSIDEKGNITNIEIARWAGFGLDEAVIDAVNKMNWRPGERNGKPLPMRVLLRYNFTKIEKEPS